jgi:hypothetical protein
MNAEKFIDLIDALKPLGSDGHFELLLYVKLSSIEKPIDDITVGELINSARSASELQAQLEIDRKPTVPQPRPETRQQF